MAAHQEQCPLDPKIFDKEWEMGLERVKAIEAHISAGNCAHPPLKELVLEGCFKDSTPLLLACAQGNLVVVNRIVERWGVDPNAAATYYYLPNDKANALNYNAYERIIGATPLIVAVCNGHEPITRYLIEKGADISAKTADVNPQDYAGLTPLYAALMDKDCSTGEGKWSSFEEKKTAIAHLLLESGADPSVLPGSRRPIWTNYFCDNNNTTMIIALINSGMSLEQRHPRHGQTVLHNWASNNPLRGRKSSLEVVKLLVKKGANLMALDDHGFTPILAAAHSFSKYGSKENLSILEYLLNRGEIGLKEKIEAMELVGAVILNIRNDRHRNNTKMFRTAFRYWRRALRLRQMETEGSELLHKIPMKRESGLTVEWVSEVDLDNIAQHPSEYGVQSFLTRLRIYSNKSFGAFLSFIEDYFRSGFPCFDCKPTLAGVLNMLLATLEAIVSFQSRQGHPVYAGAWTVKLIIEYLPHCLQRVDPFLTPEILQHSLDLMMKMEQIHLLDTAYREDRQYHMNPLHTLIKKLSGYPELLNEKNKGLLAEFVQLERVNYQERTLLHQACTHSDSADLVTVAFLLKCGIDVNASDRDGNGALHLLLAKFYPRFGRDFSIVRLLIDYGAHLDHVNRNGKTAVDLWTEYNDRTKLFRLRLPGVPQLDRLPDWCYEALPSRLMCLSARVINSYKIPYTEETLPKFLHKFVKMH